MLRKKGGQIWPEGMFYPGYPEWVKSQFIYVLEDISETSIQLSLSKLLSFKLSPHIQDTMHNRHKYIVLALLTIIYICGVHSVPPNIHGWLNIISPLLMVRQTHFRADIQRHGSIFAWIVILSVYGADPIAEIKLLISPFLRWTLDLWKIESKKFTLLY